MLDIVPTSSATPSPRQRLMRVCALATEAEMQSAIEHLEALPAVTDVRPAETGLVMLRGRIGGDGAAFNIGEATVTRAVVRLETGETGFSYLLGRWRSRARLAAIIDAAGQSPSYRTLLNTHFMEPVMARVSATAQVAREETAATRVEFFTLVRGED